jgi:hypothetical protein
MYKRATNEVGRLYRNLKVYPRILSRLEILYLTFPGSISIALIADGLRLG